PLPIPYRRRAEKYFNRVAIKIIVKTCYPTLILRYKRGQAKNNPSLRAGCTAAFGRAAPARDRFRPQEV
ncbi:MAG: hypothetical protein VX168_06370, partial [Pseudomonadota bacterium]|nr:hypothetical protein [Pseudomonadota bacterium]